MSDEKKRNETGKLFPFDDKRISEHPADITQAILTESDITIYFATTTRLPQNTIINPSVKVVITHSSFMNMMEFWLVRYNFLREVYGENLPSLDSLDRTQLNEAVNKYFPTSEEDDGAS